MQHCSSVSTAASAAPTSVTRSGAAAPHLIKDRAKAVGDLGIVTKHPGQVGVGGLHPFGWLFININTLEVLTSPNTLAKSQSVVCTHLGAELHCVETAFEVLKSGAQLDQASVAGLQLRVCRHL